MNPTSSAYFSFLYSRYLSHTRTHAHAHRHASLGVSAYVQITSPIRRCGDLIAHFQVKAAMRRPGEPPLLDAPRMDAILSEGGALEREYRRAAAGVERDWAARYFAQQATSGQKMEWRGTFVHWIKQKRGKGLARVDMHCYGLITCRVDGRTRPGDELTIALSEPAEPRLDGRTRLRFHARKV